MCFLSRTAALTVALLLAPACASATPITFDTYAAGTLITTQYTGVTVSGATVYTPTGSAVAAHSGANELISGSGAPITLSFSSGQSQVSGYYTATSALVASIFMNGGTTATSTVNLGLASGQTAFLLNGSNITRVTLTPGSGTLTLDDVNAQPQAAQTPEPASLLLLGTGLCLASLLPAWRASQRRTLEV